MNISKWLGRLFPVFCVLGTTSAFATNIQPTIVGGNEIPISNAPWQVYVQGTNGASSVACGGTIIADNYVLTAAHCLYGFDSYSYSVYAGSAYWPTGSKHEVTASFLHEDYNDETLANDIALLKISGTLPLTASAIKLVDEDNQIAFDTEASLGQQDNLYVTGWGTTTQDRQNATFNLMGTPMTGVADSVCVWNTDDGINYSQTRADMTICANNDEVKGVCTGDSGGPLTWQDPSHASDTDSGIRLIGVVSYTWAGECANTLYPDGFAEVSHYLSWISQKMNEGGDGGDETPGGGGNGGGGSGGALVGGGGGGTTSVLAFVILCIAGARRIVEKGIAR
ncbi:serine protease [Enterovibrio sp. ZSDZ35]|uniref:Serine protease n=1 Tax=Enterovibrio qingdaonensis TaxID=2899818 RepID=A0ABT5QU15_9GAMM|nr:serine protease [Enterovibrio sp. ZSDZ35]MDD1784203.1 serine protease [Enterovibrio sp. ZSDZ35]